MIPAMDSWAYWLESRSRADHPLPDGQGLGVTPLAASEATTALRVHASSRMATSPFLRLRPVKSGGITRSASTTTASM